MPTEFFEIRRLLVSKSFNWFFHNDPKDQLPTLRMPVKEGGLFAADAQSSKSLRCAVWPELP
jgi:hypothetical protein